jgi:hypothetical protein
VEKALTCIARSGRLALVRWASFAGLVLIGGCQVMADLHGGYARNLVNAPPNEPEAGDVRIRFALGTFDTSTLEPSDSHLLPEAQLRFRVNEEGSVRIGLPGLGVFVWVGEPGTIAFIASAGLLVFDGTIGPRGGFGMGSPYVDVGMLLWIAMPVALTLNTGVDYEVRFNGPYDGLYWSVTAGIAFAAL